MKFPIGRVVLTLALLVFAHRAPAADAQAIRQAIIKDNAVWVGVASTGLIDAWMGFYTPDAIVHLPGEPLASGTESVRRAVKQLLGRPQVVLEWQVQSVDVVASGDLADAIVSYEIRFLDAQGRVTRERGHRAELWRHQPDGQWRCQFDLWAAEEPRPFAAAPPPASPALPPPPSISPAPPVSSPPPTSPAPPVSSPPPTSAAPPVSSPPPTSAAPPASPTPPAPAQNPTPAQPTESPAAPSRYGAAPNDYRAAIQRYLHDHLSHPDDARVTDLGTPTEGYLTQMTGTVLMRETRRYGWLVKATVEEPASDEGAGGTRVFSFLFRGEEIVAVQSTLPSARH